MVDRTDNRNLNERRKDEHERLAIIRSGDISEALRSMSDARDAYQKIVQTFQAWAKDVKAFELNRQASVAVLEEFNRNAKVIMGDSTRFVLAECDRHIDDADVNCVTDDSRWCALLAKIGGADTASGIKMTKAAYKIAITSIASFKAKIIGMKNKTIERGASEAETATVARMLPKMEIALEIINKRKDVLVELNLKLRDALMKFAKAYAIDPKVGRDLTKEEKEILKGVM